jgi:flagellar protein FliS
LAHVRIFIEQTSELQRVKHLKPCKKRPIEHASDCQREKVMAPRNAAQAYARVGLETGVIAANPHGLVLMLFDGALCAVSDASAHLAEGRVAHKGEAISRAISIINDGLRASLDQTQGGKVAGYLLELYDYMSRRLLFANLNNDRAVLLEVTQLLGELRTSWAAIGDTVKQTVVLAVVPRYATA